MKTEFFVEYDLYDTTALEDGVESSESNSSFADMGLMKKNVKAPAYGTLEHNFFVLDGSVAEFPDKPDDLAYFSKDYVGQDGGGTQSVRVRFSKNHTSYGITLHFLNDWPLEVEITWYDFAGITLSKKKFHPNALKYFCRNQVEEYTGLEIAFTKTLPYHNAKLQYIEYGTTIIWGYDTIKSGKLVSDTDPVSDKIKTDKLTFSFIDANEDFNIGNADGLHRTFQRNQRMLPYEMVRGRKIPLGTFFLDDVSTTKNVSKISAIDYKGMLANTDFKEGRMYDGDKAGEVIGDIMAAAGIGDYAIDEETAGTPLYGTLKVQTCQKALREVLFACGSIISTSNRDGIDIHKSSRAVASSIGRDRKFTTSYQIDKYVSDVSVKYKTWTLDEKVSEITKGTYNAGIHTIQLTSPAANLTASAGLILEQKPYYVVLKTTEAQTHVVISGQKYVGEELAATASIGHIKAGEIRNTKTFSGTLLNFESAQNAAERILDYYQLQQIIKTKHLSDGERTGEWAEIENTVPGHANFIAAVESLTTDLTGGFIATSKCRGYFKSTTDYYYAGEVGELYTDEGMGEVI